MAKRKSTWRPRGELAGLAVKFEDFLKRHPDYSLAHALQESGINGLNLKAYRQWKYRQKKHEGQDIPLDAIPERVSPKTMSAYQRKRTTADAQTQVAIDLLRMALKILEAK